MAINVRTVKKALDAAGIEYMGVASGYSQMNYKRTYSLTARLEHDSDATRAKDELERVFGQVFRANEKLGTVGISWGV